MSMPEWHFIELKIAEDWPELFKSPDAGLRPAAFLRTENAPIRGRLRWFVATLSDANTAHWQLVRHAEILRVPIFPLQIPVQLHLAMATGGQWLQNVLAGLPLVNGKPMPVADYFWFLGHQTPDPRDESPTNRVWAGLLVRERDPAIQ